MAHKIFFPFYILISIYFLKYETIVRSKEERIGRTSDWLFMICTLDVMQQGSFGEFLQHKRKIPF